MELVQKTIGGCLKETASRIGQQTAIEFEDWSCTWTELDEVTDLLAARFMTAYDIQKGTHVGIWSQNSPAFAQAVLALYKLGAVVVVLNAANSTDEMIDQLDRADVEVLFYGSGARSSIFDEMIPKIRRNTPKVKYFLHIEEREAGKWLRPDSFSERSRKSLPVEEVRKNLENLPSETPACIIFTSGTTSKAKPVVLTHYGIVNVNLHVQKCMRWTTDDKTVVSVAMYHGFGLNTALAGSVIVGMTMHIVPSFRTQFVWEAISEYHCTVMLGVPSMYLALVRKEGNEVYDGSSLRSGIIGGSVITTEEFKEICRRFPQAHLIPSFGMTEASTSGSFSDWDNPLRSGEVTGGAFYEDTMARVRDINTGEIVGWSTEADPVVNPDGTKKREFGKPGELELAGFNIFKEYYKMPKETAETMTEDGWLKTGDIGYFNEFDEICITGRRKEMIIRSGENISPREIEKAIIQSGMTKQVKVVGVPNVFTQEEIAACIVVEEGQDFDPKALLQFLKPRLSYFKIPKYIFTFHELPMTASGKVRLGVLKEIAARNAADEAGLRAVGTTGNYAKAIYE